MMNKTFGGMAAWNRDKACAVVCFSLAVMQVLLVLVSWMVNAASPYSSVRSLLGSEGIRWFFGRFADNLSGPLLVWILLLSISLGVLSSSGLPSALRSLRVAGGIKSRQRFALLLVLVLFVLYVLVLFALTAIPGAILLSSTGHLFPGSFSASLVPVTAFGILMLSVAYATVSGTMSSLTDIFRSMTRGLSCVLPVLVIYIFAVQLYYSFLFVFRI